MERLKDGLCICGHRGECISGAENTLSVMRHVMEAGVDMVETDVRMSADGVLFLMHNRVLDECTDATGRLEDHTADEILKMNAAVKAEGKVPYIPAFEHPALFSDFLSLAQEFPDVVLNVEFKNIPGRNGCSREFALEAAEKGAAMLLERNLGDRTLINSFSAAVVEHIRGKYGKRFHYHTFYPWAENIGYTIPPAEYCEVVCPLNWVYREDGTRFLRQQDMPERYFEELRGSGMRIIVSGGRGEDQFGKLDRLLSLGGSIIMADDPVETLEHFRALGLHL